MEYKYNSKASYNAYGKHQEVITGLDLTKFPIVVADNNMKSSAFKLKLRDDLFDLHVYKYYSHGDYFTPAGASYKTAKSSVNFMSHPMALWETQLNFAVHCTTSALGVSTQHLTAKEPLVRSLYRFHTYYHIRRILKRMQTPLPSEHGFDKYNNQFSLENVQRIGDEYGAPTSTLKLYENERYYEKTGTWKTDVHIEHNNWSRWIMNESHGFTKQGLEKISESIRAYTYLILTSQVAARHTIVGTNAEALVAQRLFYDNLNDVINKAVNLREDVSRYQDVLKYARSKLDYSIGEGLYMLPSNMLLKALNTVIEGYNDKIIISKGGNILGKQEIKKNLKTAPLEKIDHTTPSTSGEHEDEKQALILGLCLTFLVGFYIFK